MNKSDETIVTVEAKIGVPVEKAWTYGTTRNIL
jgi:hypothetical protein